MQFKQFAPNLFISNSIEFGNYSNDVVLDILRMVDINFSLALQVPCFSTTKCLIAWHPGNPMCCHINEGHLIFLHVNGDYWSKWLYQFSHEYCHHLINGRLNDEKLGLIWFEETICEVSSMWHLHMASVQWANDSNPRKSLFAQAHRDYLNDLRSKNLSQLQLKDCLQMLDTEPTPDEHPRDWYNRIASDMFPLFVENSYLWKIILHFGDTRNWNNLDELFRHLFECADDSYSYSLEKLYDLLTY